jgi:hypothetical protein
MTALVWDQIGQRFYEGGVDRAVLYLQDGTGIPWSGVTSVTEEVSGNDSSPIYFDGVKYADLMALGDFSGSLKAYTYPDEFLEFEGVLEVGNGLFVTNQPVGRFGLSYRTKIGNDVDGENLGYKIHILYNLSAIPSSKNYETYSQEGNAMEFEWAITSIPGEVVGFRPSAHLIIDTRQMGSLLLEDLENTLYGDEFRDAELPDISTLTSFIGGWVIIRITDNGDGTWTATGPDNLITMLNSTTFQILQANAIYQDANTYMISDTTY